MRLTPQYGSPPLVLILLLLFSFTPPCAGQDPAPAAGETPAQPQGLPPELEVEWAGELRLTEAGDYEFTGPVTLSWRDSRIQADRLTLKQQRHIEADGNVLVVWGGNRIFGSRMTYDLREERGVIENAVGQVMSDYLFTADRVEKVGADKILLDSATVTTCTQPVPYWSFSVSSATIRVNHYARMWNVRLRATKAPIVYLPYLIWPVKPHRAAGLLLPEFHTTQNKGRAVSQQLFVPLGRSADVTLEGRYYTKAGFGGGGEVRFIPNREGAATFDGFYIQDKVRGFGRYRATHRQTQRFQNGFRMVADINLVSDFDYFADFERELNLVSSPTVLARLEFSRNGKWTSLNVRELRRELLASGVVQQTLPEIEWRGRSRKLGRSPFYLSFESSLASIQQSVPQQDQPLKTDYIRSDLFPAVTLPWTPLRWLDVTPRIRYRLTHWTQHQLGEPGSLAVVDRPLTRALWGYGVEVVGPKLFKIYERPEQAISSRFKHTFEPRISYEFEEAFDRSDEIILLDTDIDRVSGSGDRMSYALVQRLFARRPQARPDPEPGRLDEVVLPDHPAAVPTVPGGVSSQTGPAEAAQQPSEPVEIASVELRQSRTFDQNLSFADLDGDTIIESSSPYSPVSLTGRFNPSPAVSLDLRSSYDILFHRIRDVSISSGLRSRLANVRASLVHLEGLGFEGSAVERRRREDSTQLRLTTGLNLLRNKLQLNLDGSYDANPDPGRTHIPNKQWRVQYSTQCCTFYLERVAHDFARIEDRRDLYFRVDLRGVGKILDINY